MAGAARLFPPSPKPAGGIVTPAVRSPRVRVAKAAKDPRFLKVMAQLQASAKKVGQRPPAARKAAEAQAAAKAPANEKVAGARANQVDEIKDAKAEKPTTGGFLAVLRAEIDKVMPKNLDDADKFMKGGESGQIKGSVASNVKQQKEGASGPTEQATKAPPDTAKIEGKEVSPLPSEPATAAPPVAGAEAMPAPKPQAEVDKTAKDASASADQKMKDAELTSAQMTKANDPRFSAVLTARDKAKETAAAGPAKYRAGEQKALVQAKAGATGDSGKGLAALTATKASTGNKAKSRQQLAKEKDEAERKKVTDTIAAIFDKTKAKVEAKLSTLEADVMAVFDAGADAALATMKSSANAEIDRFKADRYSGITGGARWIADLFRDTPPEIKAIIARARQRFTTNMDAVAVRVAGMVDQRLAEAKAIVAAGQAEVKTYVAGLSPSLRAVGQQAQADVQSRFDELKQSIDDKAQDLAEKLAQKYKDASDKADAAAKEMEEANKGALKGLADKIGEIVKILAEFADRVVSLFKKAAGVVKKIVADPIGFLGNLLSAIKQGISRFVGNIWTHIKKGFMTWLFGELTKAGVEIPSDLTLPSILKLVLGVLGLTWANIRPKIVKKIGERAVTVLEKVVEILMKLFTSGPAALWAEMEAFVGDLKGMVIDAILDWVITKVITSAITKIASMFNPAGAIIQAIIMVYNVGAWLAANLSRILDFIESVVNSVDRIANGDVGGAAAWIEQALSRMIPILIGFLASLLGLGGLAAKVKSFITKVQAKVGKAVDFVIDKVFNVVKKIVGKLKGQKEDKRTEAEQRRDLDRALAEASALLRSKEPQPKIRAGLAAIKKKYQMTALDIVVDSRGPKHDVVHVHGAINPEGDTVPTPLVGPGGWQLAPGGIKAHEGVVLVNGKQVHLIARHGQHMADADMQADLIKRRQDFAAGRAALVDYYEKQKKFVDDAIAENRRNWPADPEKQQARTEKEARLKPLLADNTTKHAYWVAVNPNDRAAVAAASMTKEWRGKVAGGPRNIFDPAKTRFNDNHELEVAVVNTVNKNITEIDAALTANSKKEIKVTHAFPNNLGIGYELDSNMVVVKLGVPLTKVSAIIRASDERNKLFMVETAWPHA
ncbi:phage tail protein [Sorangium sp. So ce426]|uniref:phage tail protein n=1 Tax=Sorangium sp. So ce426 TaxID=3133312 RepID=UPI003F5CB652